MTSTAAVFTSVKAPWHLWVVGVVALLWNLSGAVTIMMAQIGRLPDISAEEAAIYAAQPLWFVIVTDIALVGAVAGAVSILLRRRAAVWLFAVSLAAIVITNTYDLATGMSAPLGTGPLVVSTIIFVLAVLELVYALAMKRRAVLH